MGNTNIFVFISLEASLVFHFHTESSETPPVKVKLTPLELLIILYCQSESHCSGGVCAQRDKP